jgi:hypothetical protein
MRNKIGALTGAAALAFSLSLGMTGFVHACGDGSCEPPAETTKGNNGYGQEKQGKAQDGENPGSDKGATADSKQDGSGLR